MDNLVEVGKAKAMDRPHKKPPSLASIERPRPAPVQNSPPPCSSSSPDFNPQPASPPGPKHHGSIELLTNAACRPSGDHEGTLIVPCPPYRYATTRGPLLPSTGIIRNVTCL